MPFSFIWVPFYPRPSALLQSWKIKLISLISIALIFTRLPFYNIFHLILDLLDLLLSYLFYYFLCHSVSISGRVLHSFKFLISKALSSLLKIPPFLSPLFFLLPIFSCHLKKFFVLQICNHIDVHQFIFLQFLFNIYLFGCTRSLFSLTGMSVLVAACSIFSWSMQTLSCSL